MEDHTDRSKKIKALRSHFCWVEILQRSGFPRAKRKAAVAVGGSLIVVDESHCERFDVRSSQIREPDTLYSGVTGKLQ